MDAEDVGELRQDVGARGFVAFFPEGDVGLRDTDGVGESVLREASGEAEVSEASALRGTRAAELSGHTEIVGCEFVGALEGEVLRVHG